jgi:hypothetical protein
MNEQDIYIVRASGAGWAVHLNSQTLGVFDKRPQAIQAAIVVAQASGRAGRVSGVLSEEAGGEMFPIWQVGRDSYSALN